MIPVMMRFWMPQPVLGPGLGPGITSPHIGFLAYDGGPDADDPYLITNASGEFYSAFQNTNFDSGPRYYMMVSGVVAYDYGSNEDVIDFFDIDATYRLRAFNRSTAFDNAEFDIEFRDSSNNAIAAIRAVKTGSYAIGVTYGSSLSSLTNTAGTTGSFPNPFGNLTFNSTSMSYTNLASSLYTNSFSFNCDAASISKIYFKIRATAFTRITTFNAVTLLVNMG